MLAIGRDRDGAGWYAIWQLEETEAIEYWSYFILMFCPFISASVEKQKRILLTFTIYCILHELVCLTYQRVPHIKYTAPSKTDAFSCAYYNNRKNV